MRIINRAKVRGKKLDEDCRKAQITRYEYGRYDPRVYCRGLADPETEELLDKCRECKALVDNSIPWDIEKAHWLDILPGQISIEEYLDTIQGGAK